MPDWTTNKITFEGDAKELIKLRELMTEEFDFNKLIPMPESLLTVSAPAEEMAVLAHITDGFTKPVTEDIAQKVFLICYGDSPFVHYEDIKCRLMKEAEDLDADEPVDLSFSLDGPSAKVPLREKGKIYVENYEKYGSATWYDWACNNWGTKWNSCDVTETASEKSVTWDFLTAWCPPVPVIQKIEQEFPDLSYEFWYTQEGDFSHSYGRRYDPCEWDCGEEE